MRNNQTPQPGPNHYLDDLQANLNQLNNNLGGINGNPTQFANSMGNWGTNMGNWAQNFAQNANQNPPQQQNPRNHSFSFSTNNSNPTPFSSQNPQNPPNQHTQANPFNATFFQQPNSANFSFPQNNQQQPHRPPPTQNSSQTRNNPFQSFQPKNKPSKKVKTSNEDLSPANFLFRKGKDFFKKRDFQNAAKFFEDAFVF